MINKPRVITRFLAHSLLHAIPKGIPIANPITWEMYATLPSTQKYTANAFYVK